MRDQADNSDKLSNMTYRKLGALTVGLLVVLSGLTIGLPSASGDLTQNPNTKLSGHDKIQASEKCANILTDPPDSVEDGKLPDDDNVSVFHEGTTKLNKPLNVSISQPGFYNSEDDLTPGDIPNETRINSYMVHFDDNTSSESRIKCTIKFNESIIGVMVNNTLLNATDDRIGANQTSYPPEDARGPELETADNLNVTTNQVTIDFEIAGAPDHIRVITKKPNQSTESQPTERVTEEAITKNLHFSAEVSRLTVLKLPRQDIVLKELSCLIQDSDAWQADRTASMEVTVGNHSRVACQGNKPSFNSTSPMEQVPPGTKIRITTNDGGVYEIDLWLKITIGNRTTS